MENIEIKNATMILLMTGHTKNICNLKVYSVYVSVAKIVMRSGTEREREREGEREREVKHSHHTK